MRHRDHEGRLEELEGFEEEGKSFRAHGMLEVNDGAMAHREFDEAAAGRIAEFRLTGVCWLSGHSVKDRVC